MEEYLPSEIARLVLGYLKEVACVETWQQFLIESPDLREYCRLYAGGKVYATNVDGKSLVQILHEYCTYARGVLRRNKNVGVDNQSDPCILTYEPKSNGNSFKHYRRVQKARTRKASLNDQNVASTSGAACRLARRFSSPFASTEIRGKHIVCATRLDFGADARTSCSGGSDSGSDAHSSLSRQQSAGEEPPMDLAKGDIPSTSGYGSQNDHPMEDNSAHIFGASHLPKTQSKDQSLQTDFNSGHVSSECKSIQTDPLCTSPIRTTSESAFVFSNTNASNETMQFTPSKIPEQVTPKHSISKRITVRSIAKTCTEFTQSQNVICRTSEIATNRHVVETSVTPRQHRDPPPYTRAPSTNSPRLILSYERSIVPSLTTPSKDASMGAEFGSPRRKSIIPRRRLLSELSPLSKQIQVPENPSPMKVLEGLDVLRELSDLDENSLSNMPIVHKITESINRVKKNDKSTGESSLSAAQEGVTLSKEEVKDILARTEAIVFDEYLSYICGSKDVFDDNFTDESVTFQNETTHNEDCGTKHSPTIQSGSRLDGGNTPQANALQTNDDSAIKESTTNVAMHEEATQNNTNLPAVSNPPSNSHVASVHSSPHIGESSNLLSIPVSNTDVNAGCQMIQQQNVNSASLLVNSVGKQITNSSEMVNVQVTCSNLSNVLASNFNNTVNTPKSNTDAAYQVIPQQITNPELMQVNSVGKQITNGSEMVNVQLTCSNPSNVLASNFNNTVNIPVSNANADAAYQIIPQQVTNPELMQVNSVGKQITNGCSEMVNVQVPCSNPSSVLVPNFNNTAYIIYNPTPTVQWGLNAAGNALIPVINPTSAVTGAVSSVIDTVTLPPNSLATNPVAPFLTISPTKLQVISSSENNAETTTIATKITSENIQGSAANQEIGVFENSLITIEVNSESVVSGNQMENRKPLKPKRKYRKIPKVVKDRNLFSKFNAKRLCESKAGADPDSPPRMQEGDPRSALEIFSEITGQPESQSPILKTLISSAKVLVGSKDGTKSPHVRMLDFGVPQNEDSQKGISMPLFSENGLISGNFTPPCEPVDTSMCLAMQANAHLQDPTSVMDMLSSETQSDIPESKNIAQNVNVAGEETSGASSCLAMQANAHLQHPTSVMDTLSSETQSDIPESNNIAPNVNVAGEETSVASSCLAMQANPHLQDLTSVMDTLSSKTQSDIPESNNIAQNVNVADEETSVASSCNQAVADRSFKPKIALPPISSRQEFCKKPLSGKPKSMEQLYERMHDGKDNTSCSISPSSMSSSSCTLDSLLARKMNSIVDNSPFKFKLNTPVTPSKGLKDCTHATSSHQEQEQFLTVMSDDNSDSDDSQFASPTKSVSSRRGIESPCSPPITRKRQQAKRLHISSSSEISPENTPVKKVPNVAVHDENAVSSPRCILKNSHDTQNMETTFRKKSQAKITTENTPIKKAPNVALHDENAVLSPKCIQQNSHNDQNTKRAKISTENTPIKKAPSVALHDKNDVSSAKCIQQNSHNEQNMKNAIHKKSSNLKHLSSSSESELDKAVSSPAKKKRKLCENAAANTQENVAHKSLKKESSDKFPAKPKIIRVKFPNAKPNFKSKSIDQDIPAGVKLPKAWKKSNVSSYSNSLTNVQVQKETATKSEASKRTSACKTKDAGNVKAKTKQKPSKHSPMKPSSHDKVKKDNVNSLPKKQTSEPTAKKVDKQVADNTKTSLYAEEPNFNIYSTGGNASLKNSNIDAKKKLKEPPPRKISNFKSRSPITKNRNPPGDKAAKKSRIRNSPNVKSDVHLKSVESHKSPKRSTSETIKRQKSVPSRLSQNQTLSESSEHEDELKSVEAHKNLSDNEDELQKAVSFLKCTEPTSPKPPPSLIPNAEISSNEIIRLIRASPYYAPEPQESSSSIGVSATTGQKKLQFLMNRLESDGLDGILRRLNYMED